MLQSETEMKLRPLISGLRRFYVFQRIRGFAFMRYINPRLTLTLTLTIHEVHCVCSEATMTSSIHALSLQQL